MKIVFAVIGKTTGSATSALISEYAGRICRFNPFEICVVPDIKAAGKVPEEKQKILEGEHLLQRFQPSDFVVLLDERGKEFSSRGFASWLEQKMAVVPKTMWFVVGGPYGFSQQVYDRANAKISLSQMTLPHELVRVFFTEQLYRAFTILRNMPYHHD